MDDDTKRRVKEGEEYLRYLYRTYGETMMLGGILARESASFMTGHPHFTGGAPQVVVKCELGKPTLRKG